MRYELTLRSASQLGRGEYLPSRLVPAGATEARVSAAFVVRCAPRALLAAFHACQLALLCMAAHARSFGLTRAWRRYFRFAPALDEYVRGAALVISHAGTRAATPLANERLR